MLTEKIQSDLTKRYTGKKKTEVLFAKAIGSYYDFPTARPNFTTLPKTFPKPITLPTNTLKWFEICIKNYLLGSAL